MLGHEQMRTATSFWSQMVRGEVFQTAAPVGLLVNKLASGAVVCAEACEVHKALS